MNTQSARPTKTLGRPFPSTVILRKASISRLLASACLLGMVSSAQGGTVTVTSNGAGQIDWSQEKTLLSFNRDIGGSTATTSPASGAWSPSDDFIFTGTGAVIDLQCTGVLGVNLLATDRTITAKSLTFNSTGFTISSSGSDIATLQTNSVSVTTASHTATISAEIIGSSGFTKSGDGTLVLTNTNSWTEGTTVSAGTLQLGNATIAGGSLGSGSVSLVTSSSVLAMADSAVRTLSNSITGAGQVKQTGSGTTTLSGTNNTFSGGTTVSAGKLIAGNASALGTGTVTVNGGTLETSVVNVNTGDLTLSAGSLNLNGTAAGTVTLAIGADLLMSGGTWNLGLATNTDSIKGTNTATFSITGGTLDLGGGVIDYTKSYTLITGFDSGAVSGLNITNYNTALYTATLGNNGVLSFALNAVPEPSTYGLIGAGALAAVAFVRRRKKTCAL